MPVRPRLRCVRLRSVSRALYGFLVGSTLTVFCLAMLPSARYPAWLGGIGLLGGLGTVAVVYWINVSWKNR